MNSLASHHNCQKLANATSSLKAVRKYQHDRLTNGKKRVHLYFDHVDGDWLNKFDNHESNEIKECHLFKDVLEV